MEVRMARHRSRTSAEPPHEPRPAAWLAGAAIGLTILTMAAGAMTLGTTAAIGQAVRPK
jgi:hypothetical protein